eukprot:gene4712-4893_t
MLQQFNPDGLSRAPTAAKYQTIEGLGAAFTDAVAHVFSGLNHTLQEQVLELIFGNSGLRYNFGRLTVGSCDFSVGSYNYDNITNDYLLSHFTVQHDEAQIIPLINRYSTGIN